MKRRLLRTTIFFVLIVGTTFYSLKAQPTIASFSPVSGPSGASVTITGSNFSPTPAGNTVSFGATQATVTAASPTQLVVKVPPGATYKPISVQVNGLIGYSSVPFVTTFSGGGFINASSFAPHADFPAGFSPQSLDIKDLDGDGLADLSFTENQIGSVSVLENNTAGGSLDLPIAFHHGPSSLDVETEDLDGDGKPELILASTAAEAVSIFKNTSVKGTIDATSFATPVQISTVIIGDRVSVADVDGDGKPDIMAPLNPTGVIIYRNATTIGSITSASFNPVSFPAINGGIFADIDNDGKPDIIASGTNKITLFKNTSTAGSISFAPQVDFSLPGSFSPAASGDVNGDGKLDIVGTSYFANSIIVMINAGTAGTITTGTFPSAQYLTLAVGTNPIEAAVGDIDGDGLVDIATINEGSDDISILKNTSVSATNVSFATAFNLTVGGSQPKNLVIGDLNGDGRPEISATVEGGANSQIAVLQNLMIDPPVIISFTPASAMIGATVTIAGTGFSNVASDNDVKFNGTSATVVSATSTTITTLVPPGASTGPITVGVNAATATSPANFTLLTLDNKIIYSRIDGTIWASSGDGSNDLFLSDGSWPRLSNDGHYLLLHKGSGTVITRQQIYNLDMTTGLSPLIFNNTDFVVYYSWALNNTKIIFDNSCSIDSMDPDGSNVNVIPQSGDCFDDAPDTRPSDNLIVFHNEYYGLLTMKIDGSGRTSIPNTLPADYWPRFSPDGNWITFTRTSVTPYVQYKIKVDGTSLTPLTQLLAGETIDGSQGGGGVWMNDGQSIVIQGTIGCVPGLFQIMADGSFTIKRIALPPAISAPDFVGNIIGTPPLTFLPLYNPLAITSFNPSGGNIGATVTISGTGFSITPGDNTVKFNGTNAVVSSSTATTLTVVVPSGATTGAITVSAACNTATSTANFTVGTIINVDKQPTDLSLCSGDTGALTISASGTTNIAYQWQYSPDGVSPYTNVSGAGYTGAQTSTLSINSKGNNIAGKYQCVVNGDGAAAVTSNIVSVDVLNAPEAPSTIAGSGCPGKTITVTASGGTDGNYRWYTGATGNNPIGGQVNSTYSAELAQSATFYVSISNGTCESSRTSVQAIVNDTGCSGNIGGTPPVIATKNLTTTTGGVATLDLISLITTDGSALDLSSLQILAQPASGAKAAINSSGILTVDYAGLSFSGSESITIQACDVNDNCSTQEFAIEVGDNHDIIIWNAVSPGGPNPTLFIQFIASNPQTASNTVTIFDRWQNQVWHGSNYDNSNVLFNGNSDGGNALPSGVYFYKIEFASGMKTKTGFISIRR